MMSVRLRLAIIIAMFLVILYIVNQVRHKRIDFKYALGWLFVDGCILVLSIWPLLLDKLALFLGIAAPVNMLFFFGFILAVLIIFSLTMTVSKLSDKVRKLTQEIAIIRKDMYENYVELRKYGENDNE